MGRITFRASSPDATSRFVPVTLEDDIELHEDFEHSLHGLARSATFESDYSTGHKNNFTANAREILDNIRKVLEAAGNRYRKQVRKVFGDLDGWRIGVLTGYLASSFVFLINLTLLLVAATRYEGFQQGIATLARGGQSSMSTMTTAYHLLINILSTLLLSSSSYTMQILSSPTRPEVDRAHMQGKWLDIGLLSTRNLRHINRKRLVLWFFLAASSVPLHLFYNSAVFKYTVAYEYNAEFVNYLSEDWKKLNASWTDREISLLSNSQLTADFDTKLVYDWTDLYIVFDAIGANLNTTGNSTSINLTINTSWPQPDWKPLANHTTIPCLNIPKQQWLNTSEGFKVHAVHGFARPAKSGQSAVQLSLHFMLAVMAANLVKAIIMGVVVSNTDLGDGASYMVTCGDAVASFLASPDLNTVNLSTASKAVIMGLVNPDENKGDLPQPAMGDSSPRIGHRWDPQQLCYGSAISSARMLWWCNALLVGSGFGIGMILGLQDQAGFDSWGSASQSTIVRSAFTTGGILLNAWLTNIPQLIFSFTYFNLNGIFTSMALAQERNTMGARRKGLRVSHPEMAQRSTYFLQLPYRWAIPLTVGSGALHWLISQTLFLVQIDVLSATGERDTKEAFVASGFSSLSCFVLALVFGSIMVATYITATLPLKEKLPFGASCSAVISAACHPPATDTEAYLRKVKWGVITALDNPNLQHRSFTSQHVSTPIVGTRYK